MKKIAYLSSQVTLPGSPSRRNDAFEHDETIDALRGPLGDHGMALYEISWDDPSANWSVFDAVIIGTTWDYWDRPQQFLATLDQIEQCTTLMNPVALVRWNSHKRYLRELQADGVSMIPTLWLDDMASVNLDDVFRTLGSDDVVFKRQVGAGAEGQHRLTNGDVLPPMAHPMLAQPFMPTIQTEGELSFVFIDGELSHALIKRARAGDYRIQSSYGGFEEQIDPEVADQAAAKQVLRKLNETPLYARVDMLRGADGTLLLMELELIEPYLYPQQGPDLGFRMAQALSRRLA